MAVSDEDEMAVVTRAIGINEMTEGTLVSLLTHVYWCEYDAAVEMVTAAYERGVIEEIRPGVVRVTDLHRRRPFLTE